MFRKSREREKVEECFCSIELTYLLLEYMMGYNINLNLKEYTLCLYSSIGPIYTAIAGNGCTAYKWSTHQYVVYTYVY